jgi:ribonuclease T1
MLRGVKTLWLAMLGLLLWQPLAQADFFSSDTSYASINAYKLPLEARDTFRLIKQGGPFPFPRDGIVFGNRERQLPKRPRGYYHEYTVSTPGVHNRGARRIVCGAVPECYYSDDHYQTFKRIKE